MTGKGKVEEGGRTAANFPLYVRPRMSTTISIAPAFWRTSRAAGSIERFLIVLRRTARREGSRREAALTRPVRGFGGRGIS